MNTTNNNPTVKMSKGFTMIELIFVIVIIGILAAVAIPRLAATRDDAKVATCSADVATLMKDLSSYYTSQGNFADDIKAMTNVEVKEAEAIALNGDGGKLQYMCEYPIGDDNEKEAVTFDFIRVQDSAKNYIVQMTATTTTDTQGTVDGDLGLMLKNKNIASEAGIKHAISGIRVKR